MSYKFCFWQPRCPCLAYSCSGVQAGTCVQGTGRCRCAAGYAGTNCQIPPGCVDSTTLNHTAKGGEISCSSDAAKDTQQTIRTTDKWGTSCYRRQFYGHCDDIRNRRVDDKQCSKIDAELCPATCMRGCAANHYEHEDYGRSGLGGIGANRRQA